MKPPLPQWIAAVRVGWWCLPLLFSLATSWGQVEFGAYYTRQETGQAWETRSRTSEFADLVLQLSHPRGQLVFWRGNSYLPQWRTGEGQWDFPEIVARSGDGARPMVDRANVYSHAEIIENTASRVVIHWRYLSRFTAGNPHGEVDPNHFVDETFTVTPQGRVTRLVKQGTPKIDDWNDSGNQTIQVLQLNGRSFAEISRQEPRHRITPSPARGNPRKGPPVTDPLLCFSFDEALGDTVRESMTQTTVTVPGHKTLWKAGVSGTALQFDGYHTVVSLPASQAPKLANGEVTLEAWFALGAYPWNWAPLVQQGDDEGYFLGVDSHGYPGFKAKIGGIWQSLTVPSQPPYRDANHLDLFHWYHVAGTYSKADGRMRLYIDGREIAQLSVGQGGLQSAAGADVRVGKAGVLQEPTEGTNTNLKSEYGFDGLIDEVRVYGVALDAGQIAQSCARFNPGSKVVSAPDMQRRAFPQFRAGGHFGGAYTHLPYYETWENMWRFGPYADVVVGFDKLPIKFVFWRGVSYIPMIVNEAGQWYTGEFCETGFTAEAPGDCEPMSDKGCWDSHVRLIENTPARVVVHWRYRLANPSHQWANYDPVTGWGDIADWLYYIYPDGVAIKRMRCYSSVPDTWHEWDEQIAVLGEGQHPESVIGKTPVMTLVDSNGKTFEYSWVTQPPAPEYAGKIAQKLEYTGQYDPFSIQKFDGGDMYSGERTWYSVTPAWNHWPTAQVNSSGRNASFADRAAHSSISHLFWPYSQRQRGAAAFDEKLLMEGMTRQATSSLAGLAKSWMDAPPVEEITGGTSLGYNQAKRAYEFRAAAGRLAFRIEATPDHPIRNLCFEIKGWGNRLSKAFLRRNGELQKRGANIRQGMIIDTDGTYTRVIWIECEAESPQSFVIEGATPQ